MNKTVKAQTVPGVFIAFSVHTLSRCDMTFFSPCKIQILKISNAYHAHTTSFILKQMVVSILGRKPHFWFQRGPCRSLIHLSQILTLRGKLLHVLSWNSKETIHFSQAYFLYSGGSRLQILSQKSFFISIDSLCDFWGLVLNPIGFCQRR